MCPQNEFLCCVSSSGVLLGGGRAWEFRSWGAVVASHQLRGRVPRKEAGDLPGNQQGISCNFIKMEPTLGYFPLSFDKLMFFNGANLSAEHSGQLCYNQTSSAEVGTLKISVAFSPHSATSIQKLYVSFDSLCSLKGSKRYVSTTSPPTCS